RRAVAGARSQEATGAQLRDPETARSRRRSADPGLEARLLHGLAVREEPDHAPVHLQLRPDAGSVERPVTSRAVASASRPTSLTAPPSLCSPCWACRW